jgi:NAD(P)-dependent dehydrogenase (short-subunit alcohol dehydrogenase family)
VSQLAARVLELAGRLDGVVNNAGIEGPLGPIEEIAIADVRRVFDVNVFGLLAVIQAVLPHFRSQRSGRIVNIASGAGLAGSGHMTPYSASKHAVVGITRSVAAEAGAAGIAVNAVCPGCVDSPMMGRIEERLSALKGEPVSFAPSVPMGRYARPDEVAELVAYLALEAPDYITGAALVIDGGLRA